MDKEIGEKGEGIGLRNTNKRGKEWTKKKVRKEKGLDKEGEKGKRLDKEIRGKWKRIGQRNKHE